MKRELERFASRRSGTHAAENPTTSDVGEDSAAAKPLTADSNSDHTYAVWLCFLRFGIFPTSFRVLFIEARLYASKTTFSFLRAVHIAYHIFFF